MGNDDIRHFSGAGVETVDDNIRLGKQIDKVLSFIKNGEWFSLSQISEAINAPHASVSAQLRNLRKREHGSYIIERKNEGSGYHLYRLSGVDTEQTSPRIKPSQRIISALQARVKQLETAIKTADPIELGRIKGELEKGSE